MLVLVWKQQNTHCNVYIVDCCILFNALLIVLYRNIILTNLLCCVFCFQTSPYYSAQCNPSSEPSSLMSSPSSSPVPKHRQHQQNGQLRRHHLKDGYSSLERLNRRPRVNKCSLEKLFLRRASLETVTTTLRHDDRLSSEVPGICGGGSSSDEEDGFLDDAEFVRNRKERSTVLVRRFYKNNQKVHRYKILVLLCGSLSWFSEFLFLCRIWILNKHLQFIFWKSYFLYVYFNPFHPHNSLHINSS